ncbi:MAG: hypothetical protein RL094_209 [Candidatus Parcubacteria bacterium]|jgi:adenylate kinase family enzyme
MTPKTFILIGRSGSGKGTQAKLLREALASKETEGRNIYYVETGARFREFIQGESYSSSLAAEINKIGARQPDFLAVWNWAHYLVHDMTGEEHLMFDGTPRSYGEAVIIDGALKFYKREKPIVVYLNVSREWSRKHLLARGRMDDKTEDEVDRRLNWFDTDVMPAVEYFKKHPEYQFVDVHGEQSIEEVHQEIIKAVNL